MPANVLEREFRRYLHCGLLARGFARLRCPECGFERLVAFICKGRLCPSCTSGSQSTECSSVASSVSSCAPCSPGKHSEPCARYPRWLTGSVIFVQRFGGALNLNPHFHSVLPDGLFVPCDPGGTLAFVPLPEPTSADIEVLMLKIARRITAAVEKMCADDAQTEAVLERTAAALRQALAAALEPPLPKLGRDLLGLDPQAMTTPLCAKIAGFSLHCRMRFTQTNARVLHPT